MDDLWDALTAQAHSDGNLPSSISVKDIALSWIDKNRLPFLTVVRNYEENSAKLTQGLFIRRGPKYVVKDEGLLWDIPVVLVTQRSLNFTNTKPKYWMKKRDLDANDIGVSTQFIIINPEEIASYMVNYDENNWNMLSQFLQTDERNKIPEVTRAKLIHDALNFAYAGILDFGTALNMTVYLKHERNILVWTPFMNMFDHITRDIEGRSVHQKFELYVRNLVTPIYTYLNSDEKNLDKHSYALLKKLKATLRELGYEPILKEADSEYEKWMQDTSRGYKSVEKYLCTIYRYGTNGQWEFGLKKLQNLQSRETEISRNYLLKSLVGCTNDKLRIHKILNIMIFGPNNIFTDEDIEYALIMLTGGADSYMATFEYLQDNWSALKVRFEGKPKIWEQLIYTATHLFKTQEGLDKVSAFYSEHHGQFGEAESTIENSLKNIKEEVQRTNANLKSLENWLDKHNA